MPEADVEAAAASERVASEARSGAARVNLLLTGSISDGMLLCRYVTMIARV